MRTYMIYTQCEHCGVYDRDTAWCTLCQKTKQARDKVNAPATSPAKASALSGGGQGTRRRPAGFA